MMPLLEEVQPPCAVAVPVHFKAEQYHDHFTYDVVELNGKTSAALTPPQTPPQEHALLTNLDLMGQQQNQAIYINQSHLDLEKTAIYSVPDKQFPSSGSPLTISNQFASSNTHNYDYASNVHQDLAHELAVVDELVRTRVENMHWTSSGPSSPDSSSQSNFGDYSSSDDPEWIPEPNGLQSNLAIPESYSKKLKYFKGTEDKRSRKKEQNKNAATRYRLKKKAEVEEIVNEEKSLLADNNELNSKITDLQREIKYLKGLMRELFKAKNVITY